VGAVADVEAIARVAAGIDERVGANRDRERLEFALRRPRFRLSSEHTRDVNLERHVRHGPGAGCRAKTNRAAAARRLELCVGDFLRRNDIHEGREGYEGHEC
jgi:hypothetical protein